MPDSKISGLTSATTPLAGTEVLPIVQSGVTTQVSVANLTAGRGISVTTLSMSGQLTNTLATGTAPFVISSTTRVSNLNVATAGTADTLTTTRTLWGQNFNGGANVTGSLTSVGDITGTAGVTLTATGGTLGLVATGANVITASTNGSERMRIDSAGNVGIGTSSPGQLLVASSGTNTVIQSVSTNTANSGRFRATNADGNNFDMLMNGSTTATNPSCALISVPLNTTPLLFYMSGVERMRLSSGGFGIGTNNPAALLHVSGAGTTQAILTSNDQTTTYLRFTNTTHNGGYIGYTSDNLIFLTGSSERMRLDASGNLGLGVTPSAWGSIFRAVQVGSANYFSFASQNSASSRGSILWNAYGTGDETFAYNKTGDNATRFSQQYDFRWYLAPSGTAGSTISFTEAMRIASTGNVGIGTSSPADKVQIEGNLYFGTTSRTIYQGGSANLNLQVNTGQILFLRDLGANESMRINASGNVGIGTSSPDAKLRVNGTAKIGEGAASNTSKLMVNTVSGVAAGIQLFQDANESWIIQNPASTTALTFANSGTERMRITATGDVGIGTSSPSAKLDVVGGVEATAFLDGPLYDSAFKRFTNPGGGIYTTATSSVTGAIRITFPVGATDTMVKVTVKVYEYQTNRSFEIHFGGYTYNVGPSWANNPYAYIVGSPTIDRQFTVRLGYDSTATKMVAYIGELASTWAYPQVYITEVQCGYAGFSANFATGWAIGFEATAFQNVTATISTPQVGYQATAGQNIQGSVRYAGTTSTAGMFDGGTTTPTGTTRLNYSGYLYPTFLNLIGSADTTTAATHYFVEQSSDGFVRPKTIANVRTEIVTTAAVSAATAAGAIAFAAGSAAAPSIYPTGDTNTGIFFPAADTIAFSEGGAESMRIDASGNVGIGTSSPSERLHVVGNSYFNGANLTFQSTSNGQVVFGQNNSVGLLRLANNSGTPFIELFNAGDNRLVGTSNSDFSFYTNNTERLRITSAGDVGIGTSSPASKLNIYDASVAILNIQGDSVASVLTQRYSTDTTGPTLGFRKYRGSVASPTAVASGDTAGSVNFNAYGGTNVRAIAAVTAVVDAYVSDTNISGYLTFGTSPAGSAAQTERLRITSAGNIHTPAGTTSMTNGFIYIPAAAGVPTGAATAITGTVPLYYNSSANTLYAYNSGWQTISGGLSLLSTNANGVVYLNGSSQATTSSGFSYTGTELTVTTSITSSLLSTASSSYIRTGAVANLDLTYLRQYGNTATGTTSGLSNAGLGILSFEGANGGLIATTQPDPLVFATNGTERMRITDTGNVGIGLTNPSEKLVVAGNIYQNSTVAGGNVFTLIYNTSSAANSLSQFALWNNNGFSTSSVDISFYSSSGSHTSAAANELRIRNGANAPMTFYTNNTERMRITGAGDLVLGDTATVGSSRFFIRSPGNTSATFSIYISNTSSTALFGVRDDGGFSTGVASLSPYNRTTASAANVFVDSVGYLFRSTSSARYKTDIKDATHGLAELLTLRPVTFKSKGGDDTVYAGLIAEEVHEAGLTEFVEYNANGEPDAVYYSNMVSLLTKAIQEQQAIIESLTARITALESAN